MLGAAGHRFEEDSLRRQPGEVDGEVTAPDVFEELGGQLGNPCGEHEQVALRFAEVGQNLLGEEVEEDRVGAEQMLDQGTAIQRSAAAGGFDSEVHSERPATGGGHDVEHRGLRRRVEAEPGDVGWTDGELLGPDAGDLAGRTQASDA